MNLFLILGYFQQVDHHQGRQLRLLSCNFDQVLACLDKVSHNQLKTFILVFFPWLFTPKLKIKSGHVLLLDNFLIKESWNFNGPKYLRYYCSVLLLESSTVNWKVIWVLMLDHLHWDKIFSKIHKKASFVANSSLFRPLLGITILQRNRSLPLFEITPSSDFMPNTRKSDGAN